MKCRFILLLIFVISSCNLFAQDKSRIAGVYYLRGVMETASGFKLNEDSTFEFYFSYGALDRYGSGRWKVKNDSVILNSKSFPGKDFNIVDSSLTSDNSITIKIEDQNNNLYRFVYCLINTAVGNSLINADSDGMIILPKADTIRLLFELSPERMSIFPVSNLKFNSYTFILNRGLSKCFLKTSLCIM